MIRNKENVAIVVVGYNRLKSISRLLQSLLSADYPNNNIPLYISIDCSGDTELYDYVRQFNWPFGDKYVNIQETRLGLKEHIFKCGNLTKFFKAIILLEDDIFVSKYFYNYVIETINIYGDDNNIAQISLYRNETNGYVSLPFDHMRTGEDVFLMQDVSTWGECWTEQMWQHFWEWYSEHDEDYIQKVDMPDMIKKWSKAWSKYYNAYVVDTGKYVLYPALSLTTNFSDAGVHGGNNNSLVQVNLAQGDFKYRMSDVESLVKYDIYSNNVLLYEWLGLTHEDVTLDIYGNKNNWNSKRYVLTTRVINAKIVRSYALNMRPIELNVKYNIMGVGLYLYDLDEYKGDYGFYSNLLTLYFLKGYHPWLLVRYIKMDFIRTIYRKIRGYYGAIK